MDVGLRTISKGSWKQPHGGREGGEGMSWKYAAPQRCDFDTEEEYEEAMSYYEDAADLYAEEYIERSRR